MITNNDIDTLARATAYGHGGDKLGKVGEVYLDNRTGEPGWITVVTGLFGTRRHFVPVDGATLDGAGVHVPFDKDTVTGAPNIEENGELTPLEEDELYRYYSRAGSPTDAAVGSEPTARPRTSAGDDTAARTGGTHTIPPEVAGEAVAGDYRRPSDTVRSDAAGRADAGSTAPETGRGSDTAGKHDRGETSGSGHDEPRTPRLVKRVVTTEYYEEHPGDTDRREP